MNGSNPLSKKSSRSGNRTPGASVTGSNVTNYTNRELALVVHIKEEPLPGFGHMSHQYYRSRYCVNAQRVAFVAQMVERRTFNPVVAGSSPAEGAFYCELPHWRNG